jgi:molecular chaperone Hsp33
MTPAPIDPALAARYASLQPDGLEIFTLDGGKIRGALLSSTALTAQARANHRLGILETVALGQALACGALLSSTIKGRDRISIRMDCEGPLGGFNVDADASGDVRGYLFRDSIAVDKPLDSFDLAPFIQRGALSVTRTIEGRTKPFTGRSELSGRGIAGELSRYFLVSEQTNTAFFVSVRLDTEGKLLGSGGLFLQALPGADPEALDWAEKVIAEAPSLGTWFGEGKSRREFVIRHFLFAGVDFLGEKKARFFCPCGRERFRSYLLAMKPQDLEKALVDGNREREGKPCIEISCHSCGTVYVFMGDELL